MKKNTNLWWRPSKISPEIVKKLEEAFALDATMEECVFYAWISKQTFYNWMEKDQDLWTRLKALKNKPVLLARQELIKWLKDNPELALKYLERKRKDEFSTKTETDNKVSWDIIIKLPE
jgi:hypothetical protein